ncbi:MAG TPA: hypothetical protein DDY14_13790 [Chromatiaceae bacterium]|jgi:hypothetical protein|nr:MAG: hypothetical protein N838_20870 [Thiohalocapsa sp. PB-PSB1]QQO52188.1 MAG: hypothetical protein N838_01125 [Thiohalocapsa sp. PB-PSB1]HBG96352.1 hypothetical protein [Chromatiaceae bacterium]HCS90145.1 hypothetical protein [Chromatiaceae bacterium]
MLKPISTIALSLAVVSMAGTAALTMQPTNTERSASSQMAAAVGTPSSLANTESWKRRGTRHGHDLRPSQAFTSSNAIPSRGTRVGYEPKVLDDSDASVDLSQRRGTRDAG